MHFKRLLIIWMDNSPSKFILEHSPLLIKMGNRGIIGEEAVHNTKEEGNNEKM